MGDFWEVPDPVGNIGICVSHLARRPGPQGLKCCGQSANGGKGTCMLLGGTEHLRENWGTRCCLLGREVVTGDRGGKEIHFPFFHGYHHSFFNFERFWDSKCNSLEEL